MMSLYKYRHSLWPFILNLLGRFKLAPLYLLTTNLIQNAQKNIISNCLIHQLEVTEEVNRGTILWLVSGTNLFYVHLDGHEETSAAEYDPHTSTNAPSNSKKRTHTQQTAQSTTTNKRPKLTPSSVNDDSNHRSIHPVSTIKPIFAVTIVCGT